MTITTPYSNVKFYIPTEVTYGGDANGYEFHQYRVPTDVLRNAFESRLGKLPNGFEGMLLTDKPLLRLPFNLPITVNTKVVQTHLCGKLARILRSYHLPEAPQTPQRPPALEGGVLGGAAIAPA